MSSEAKEIERTKKWLSNYCIHYNQRGMPDECNARVNYRKLAGEPQFGMILRLPCLREHDTAIVCEKREFPSDGELEKQAREIMKSRKVVLEALPAAKEHAAERGFGEGNGGRGELPCPVCAGGTLRYSVAGVNGHMHAACTTEGCARWME